MRVVRPGVIATDDVLVFDPSMDNKMVLRIGKSLYLLQMEGPGDQVVMRDGLAMLGVGSRLRFDSDNWVPLFGAKYRGGGVAITDTGLAFDKGTKRLAKERVLVYNGHGWGQNGELQGTLPRGDGAEPTDLSIKRLIVPAERFPPSCGLARLRPGDQPPPHIKTNPQLSGERGFIEALLRMVDAKALDPRGVTAALWSLYTSEAPEDETGVIAFSFSDAGRAAWAARLLTDGGHVVFQERNLVALVWTDCDEYYDDPACKVILRYLHERLGKPLQQPPRYETIFRESSVGTSHVSVDGAYEILAEALRSDRPRLQALAAETFLESSRQPPRGAIEHLADSSDARVRFTVLVVLGAAPRSDLEPLFRRKLRDVDPNVRLAAAFGLAMTGDESQIMTLRDGLMSARPAIRRTAAWLLGRLGSRGSIEMLKAKLEDPDAVVVLRAAEALCPMGSDLAQARVRELTRHGDRRIGILAVRLLGRVGTQADIPRLLELSEPGVLLDLRFAAIAALAKLGNLARIRRLVGFLDAENETFRMLALQEVAESGYRPALVRLEKRLGATDPIERVLAAAAMVRIESHSQLAKRR